MKEAQKEDLFPRSEPPFIYSYQQIYEKQKPSKLNRFGGFLALNIRRKVGLPGFEPGQTEPKPVVLPLHHNPNFKCFLLKSGAKIRGYENICKFFATFLMQRPCKSKVKASAKPRKKHLPLSVNISINIDAAFRSVRQPHHSSGRYNAKHRKYRPKQKVSAQKHTP